MTNLSTSSFIELQKSSVAAEQKYYNVSYFIFSLDRSCSLLGPTYRTYTLRIYLKMT